MLGKLLGAMLGSALGMLLAWSVPMAVTLGALGALLGHLFIDREPSAPKSFAPPSTEDILREGRRAGPVPGRRAREPRPLPRVSSDDLALLQALCPLFVEVARADAPVSQVEVRIIREFFEHRLNFDAAAMQEVKDALKAAIASPPGDVEAMTTRARTLVKPSIRVEVVRSLYDVGMVDGDLQRSEQDVLKRVVGAFNLSDEQLQQVTQEYFGKGDANYATLGVKPDASDDEVKSAYRRLAAEHHPDRATDGGEKFRQVKDAWDAVRKLRGL